ncbi:MAG: GGDEF domain-containing protein [Burkholderiales bacterium]|nr:GGDEF domain-containing protein [Burkholderiales bacterium]
MVLRIFLRQVITLCCGLLWLAPVALWAQPLEAGVPGTGARDVTPHWAWLQDASNRRTLEQVQQAYASGQFTAAQGAETALSFGFTPSAYWLRLALHNPADQASAQMLEIANPRISSVEFYAPDATGIYRAVRTGGDQPFATRAVANRQFVLPLELAPHTLQVIYLRVQSTIGLIVPGQLWPAQDFAHHVRNDYTVQAGYFGIAVAMLLFNLMLFIALRDRIYLLYAAYVVCALLTIASKNGLAAEFLWPDTLVWSNFSYFASASMALLALTAFTRDMLSTATALPRMDRLLRALMGVHLLAPVVYWLAIRTVAPLTIAVFMLTTLVLIGVGLWCVFKCMRSAYIYTGAFVLLFAGGMMTLMRTLGWLPTNVFTVNGMQLGSSLEMMLLAFALADRFNLLRREKLQAQRALMQTLQTTERQLTQRVEERTQQLQILNDKLEALTLVDDLTGVANRRQFDQVLHKEWLRMERLRQPLALLMLDVDWFKPFNDHYGHQAGDQCLRAVATAVACLSRTSDLVARYGGEEFVLIAPATDSESAMALARRACEAVQALALEHVRSDKGVITISVGVAALASGTGHTAEELLRAADAALYQAKAWGRNQAVLAGGF